MQKDKKKNIHIAITVFVMLFIFIQSALPGDLSGAESNIIVRIIATVTGMAVEPSELLLRKAAHFTEFMILGGCLAINVQDLVQLGFNDRELSQDNRLPQSVNMSPFRTWFIPWLLGTAYAVTDELHQYFVPERACAFLDVCIDSAGVAVGAALICCYYLRRTK